MKTPIYQSREFSEVEQYLLMSSPSIKSAKDIDDGQKITVESYMIFTDEKDDGSSVEVMAIMTPDKKVYSCQSATFKRSIQEIASIMKGKQFTVVKSSGKTKSNRDFINCYLDTEGLI